MARPKQVKIGKRTWPITWSLKEWRAHPRNVKNAVGWFDKHGIAIKPGLSPRWQRRILWHEIKHAVNKEVGITGKKKRSEEYHVTHAGLVEAITLERNPELRRWLWGPVTK